ncbi:MAG: photosynthetic reaction center cytochrome c subunit family protein, partial [Planctomycetota bacterium]|nr:photosynthetic reaction center cytochrome c subunit family protein [Planctomycetota bacterium]
QDMAKQLNSNEAAEAGVAIWVKVTCLVCHNGQWVPRTDWIEETPGNTASGALDPKKVSGKNIADAIDLAIGDFPKSVANEDRNLGLSAQ